MITDQYVDTTSDILSVVNNSVKTKLILKTSVYGLAKNLTHAVMDTV